MPEGMVYEMVYYETDLLPNDVLSGGMKHLELPVGGKIEWTYAKYDFESQDSLLVESAANSSFSVKERRIYEDEADAFPVGSWVYGYEANGNPAVPGTDERALLSHPNGPRPPWQRDRAFLQYRECPAQLDLTACRSPTVIPTNRRRSSMPRMDRS